jgi:[acyl-carrier-protein] S-malonyltransferase
MTGRLLLLCPGQGGQHPAMFDLARTHAGARDFLSQCALPADTQALFENCVAQPAIVAATLATWLALKDVLPAPALVAGYSIGELSAYGVAGALAPAEGVRLAGARAALMNAAAAGQTQGLAAVSGVDVAQVGSVIDVAIVTGHDSCIAGGTLEQLDALPARLPAARVQRLPVGVASHTALMAGAVQPFTALLEQAAFAPWKVPVLAGIDASRVLRRERAIHSLARQLSETIAWASCMDAASEAGITVALELGPGAALARMLQARHPQIACRSVADFHTIEGIASWVARERD